MMRRAVLAVSLLVLAACSKDKEVDPPAELTEFTSTLRVQRVWDANVGGDDKPLRLGLGLAVEGNRVFAAGHEGEIAAFDLGNGKRLWETKTKTSLSGGTGAAGDLVSVGTSDGEVITLNAANGAILWRAKVNGEVLSAPAISPQAIVVRTVDGKLHGLAPSDGHEIWQHEEQVPRLSLRGTSRPVISNDVVLCGFDNGKVVAVNLGDGSLIWETPVAPPHGKTELERLVDIDSAARVSGNDVYTVGFQGRVAMLAFDTGQVWWAHDASSYRGLGLDDDAMYVSSSDGEVVALRRKTGAEIWRQNVLLHRGLSAPAVGDSTVAVADFQGYVHWLDKATGTLAARASSGKVRVTNAPVAVGDMVLVINDEGRISAFRASPVSAKNEVRARSGRKTPPAEIANPPAEGASPDAGAQPAAPVEAAPESPAPAAPPSASPDASPPLDLRVPPNALPMPEAPPPESTPSEPPNSASEPSGTEPPQDPKTLEPKPQTSERQ
jgi:outer membrane protein assembly factor BamB